MCQNRGYGDDRSHRDQDRAATARRLLLTGGTPGDLPSGGPNLAARFKALADPARLRLISLVAAHADAEACVCELTEPVGLSQPTVSHHLKILVDAGILAREQRGKWAYYRLLPDTLDTLAGLITSPTPRVMAAE